MIIQTGKRTPKKELLPPPYFSQADGTIISRENIKNGATFVVPPIAQAKAGDRLSLFSYAEESGFSTTLELSEQHLGKPLQFNVLAIHFVNTDWVDASYVLKQGESENLSNKSMYKVTD